MKRYTTISLMFILITIVAGCGQLYIDEGLELYNLDYQYDESKLELYALDYESDTPPAPLASVPLATLTFTTLEELLYAHMAFRAGQMDAELAGLAQRVNFAELGRLYLPTGIPENYKLFRIRVTEHFVDFWYLPERHLVSEETIRDALREFRAFQFQFSRLNLDDPMAGLKQQFADNWIDGTYHLSTSNNFTWTSESEILLLATPTPLNFAPLNSDVSALHQDVTYDTASEFHAYMASLGYFSVASMAGSITQVATIDLADIFAVQQVLAEIEQAR